MPKSSFAENVKKYREERGLTQTEFAVLCRASKRTIARIEAGDQVSGRIQNFISKLIQIK